MMVGVNISDEQLGSIADRTIQEADQDGDSAISFAEFVKVSDNFQISKSEVLRVYLPFYFITVGRTFSSKGCPDCFFPTYY